MPYAIVVFAPRGQPPAPFGVPFGATPPSHITKGAALRCVLVNGAQLKIDTYCAACGARIGGSYARQIDTKKVFCDFGCYETFGCRQKSYGARSA